MFGEYSAEFVRLTLNLIVGFNVGSALGLLGPTSMLVMPVMWKDICALKKYGANSATKSVTSV